MYTEKILDSENKHRTKTRKSQLKPLISVILDSLQQQQTMRKRVPMPAPVSESVSKRDLQANFKIPED